MRLRITLSTLNSVTRPFKVDLGDIISIQPKLEIGALNACSLATIYDKVLVITNGIIMMYNNLGDFLAGNEPLAMAKDEAIEYDQEGGMIDFQIVDDTNTAFDENFIAIRELMFGARANNDETTTEVS